MRVSPQVYVAGSVDAARLYAEALGADIAVEMFDETGAAYSHCELTKGGSLVLAVSEAPSGCDTGPKSTWQTMALNVEGFGTEEAVQRAFGLLAAGGTVIDPVGSCPWNACCANVIDRFGVFWWIAI